MAEIKLFFADCAGVPSNCSYPHEAVITDEALLRRAVSHDYVCVAYRNGYRTNSNFMNATCMGMNCTVDWKFVVALGLATAGIIFSMKTDAEDAKEVLIHAVDACNEWAITAGGRC